MKNNVKDLVRDINKKDDENFWNYEFTIGCISEKKIFKD